MTITFFLYLIKSFSRRELFIFIAACLVFSVSSAFLAIELIGANTKIVPISGGEYVEGIIGQPSFINPILAANNVDYDLAELIFDSLFDLAESYKLDESGKIWRYRLKENLFWHDNQPITSDDIMFTVGIIQDPSIYSPLFQSWQGVEAKRISEREIEFQLFSPYVFFKNTLEAFKPIPKHIFGDIPASNLKLSNYNLQPIGSGPYKFKSFRQRSDGYIDSLTLEKNEDYFDFNPYIKRFNLMFYRSESEAIEDFNLGIIDGLGLTDINNLSKVNINHRLFPARTLKYYALFFNPYSQPALKDKNVRLALNLATNKKEIIETIFNDQAVLADGPLVLGAEGFDEKVYSRQNFSLQEAQSVLEATGWRLNPSLSVDGEENIRSKEIEKEIIKLEFTLVVPEISFLIQTADLIRNDWSKIGVKLNLLTFPLAEINNKIIKARDYQMIIFGNILSKTPDLFSFWHSSERFYPGLNLALYENKVSDRLIESIRENFDDKKRQADFSSLQSLIIADQPAIFLYSPNYLYLSKKNLAGLEIDFLSLPSERFKNIEKWYVKTARVFK